MLPVRAVCLVAGCFLLAAGIGTVVSAVTVGRFVNFVNSHVPLHRIIPRPLAVGEVENPPFG